VRISVADTGVGIRPEDLERIFSEFQQVGSPKSPQIGSGLGLTIARKLANLLGGDIEVTSRVGKGSTFTLSLPHSATGSGALASSAASASS
jgi:signal transduction histidine kinase